MHVLAPAERAEGARIVMHFAARLAFADQQLTLSRGRPVGRVCRIDGGNVRPLLSACHLYHPVNSVGRFSTNACTPSLESCAYDWSSCAMASATNAPGRSVSGESLSRRLVNAMALVGADASRPAKSATVVSNSS